MKRFWLLAVVLLAFLIGRGGPGFRRYKADDVTKHLQAQGLAIADIQHAARDPQSVAQNVAIEDVQFSIASVPPKGGHVLIFKEQKELDAMRTWYARLPDLALYVYTKGTPCCN